MFHSVGVEQHVLMHLHVHPQGSQETFTPASTPPAISTADPRQATQGAFPKIHPREHQTKYITHHRPTSQVEAETLPDIEHVVDLVTVDHGDI